jgi:hypothetical protein
VHVEVQFHIFLTSALDGDKLFNFTPTLFYTLAETAPVQITDEVGRGLRACLHTSKNRDIPCSSWESRPDIPAGRRKVRRYTD